MSQDEEKKIDELESEAQADPEELEEEETPGRILFNALDDEGLVNEIWDNLNDRRKKRYENAAEELDITI